MRPTRIRDIKMKNGFIVVLLVLCVSICYSQIDVQKQEFPNYQGIVSVENKSANDIYSKSKVWIVTNFKSANDVIQLDDKDNGKLIVKGNTTVLFTFMKTKYPSRVHFTLTIDIKDNRFRYTYLVTEVMDESGKYPVSIMNSMHNKPNKATIIEIKENISIKFKEIIEYINNSINNTSDDQW